jgi:hypothetical protein
MTIGRPPLVDIRWKSAKKRDRARTPGPDFENAVDRFDYFSEELIVLKLEINAVPTPLTAAMIAIAIPAAINAYSMAVAADSSRKNAESICFHGSCAPLRHTLGTRGSPLVPRSGT